MQAAAVFDALGNPVRRELLELLAEEPQTVGTLAARFPISRPAISKHLRLLQDANLVRFDKRGTRHVFEIDGEGLQAARRWLDAFWDDALARFALVAENTAAARDGDDP